MRDVSAGQSLVGAKLAVLENLITQQQSINLTKDALMRKTLDNLLQRTSSGGNSVLDRQDSKQD